MSIKDKAEEEIRKGVKRRVVEAKIIGYSIPDLSASEAANELLLVPDIVFSSEKGTVKKSLLFDTIDEAKAAIKKRYNRDQ